MPYYTSGGYWRPSYPGKVCQHCSAVYTAHSKAQRFCGNECKDASKRKAVNCGFCGSAFEIARSKTVETCSRACAYALMKKRTRERHSADPLLQRSCVICNSRFTVAHSSEVGRTCSKPCRLLHMAETKRGTKASPETKAKMSAAADAAWADPETRQRRLDAHRVAIADWHADPANAEAFAKRQSERMKRLHGEPEFRKRRDERSSRVMKANWNQYRDIFVAQATERYLQMKQSGTGIESDDAKARKAIAAKWIMKKAQEALHTETDYNEIYAEVQARLRREMPYDGPQDGSEYMDYLQKLGVAVVNSPECRNLADTFLSEAIPRFAAEWRRRKGAAAITAGTRSAET